MPVLVRPQRLLETGSLARCGEVEPVRVRAELQSRDSVLACVQHLARLGGAHWPSISRIVDLF
jgi:hypothetical protein